MKSSRTTSCGALRRGLSSLSILAALTLTSSLATAQVSAETMIATGEGAFGGALDPFDLFGWSTASIGDLDGDGVPDMAVGSFLDDDGAHDAGAVWILFLMPDGSVKSHTKISATSGGFTGALDASDYFGTSIASLGDLNGDGVTDLAVGAYYDDDGAPDTGAVWILFLETDGTVKGHTKISSTSGGFGVTLDPLDWFGWALANLGDLDGDGVVDLAVAADGLDDGDLPGSDPGGLFVLFLETDGTVKSHTKISATSGGFGGSLMPSAYFGSALANIGDLDGDGVIDLAVGSDGDDVPVEDAGALWILFMKSDGTVKGETRIGSLTPGFPGALSFHDQFGRSAASVGDIDGDGLPEVFVGADRTDDGGPDVGALYILSLAPDGTPVGGGKISATEGGFGGVLGDSDHFGNAVAVLGDLDGNGAPELAVGAEGSDVGGPEMGSAWVIFLGPPAGPEPYCFSETCPCGNVDPAAGCGNSTGGGALITASGSTSVSADDLVLTVEGVPTSKVGLLFMGGAATSLPFGDGMRCIDAGTSGLFRFGGQSSGAGGMLVEGPGMAGATPLIAPGTTRYFQGWFRDPSGPCGTGFNLSNAIKVDFVP